MTGSLQVKNGKFYIVLNYKDDNGKRKQKWITSGLSYKNNRRKAEAMLTELIAEHSGTSYIEPSKILLCDYIKDWVHATKTKVQATTYDVYVHMLEKHIYPYFKPLEITLSNVTPAIIQKYINDKILEGLSPNTAIKQFAIIRSALQEGKKIKLLNENVCDWVDKPKRTKYYNEYYNAEEIKVLLTVAKGTPIESAILLGALGLRRSECIGARWSAVDFIGCTLTVKHKVVLAKENGVVKIYATDDLKTDSSYRMLPLDEKLLNYFQNLKTQQDNIRERNGNSHSHEYNDYICVNELGELINPDYVTHYFAKLLKRNNLKKIRFHDLRHSCASLLLALGYSMKDIQEWLGHSNYQTTAAYYAHLDPRNKKNMIQGISNAISI